MKITSILIFFILASAVSAQYKTENWEPVKGIHGDIIYIETDGLSSYTGNDIYVWTKKEHTTPVVIESFDEKIYRTNTYYLLNKELKKYSLVEIVYYDKDGHVIESYSYNVKKGENKYKYNYPIMPGSDEEKILESALNYTGNSK